MRDAHGVAGVLEHVHRIDLSRIPPDPEFAAALASLPGRKLVFTNGTRRHAENVLGHLGIGKHFDGIWDIAAGALLVREAGGVVTDWRGDPHDVFVSGDVLAGTRAWHEAMLEIVAA